MLTITNIDPTGDEIESPAPGLYKAKCPVCSKWTHDGRSAAYPTSVYQRRRFFRCCIDFDRGIGQCQPDPTAEPVLPERLTEHSDMFSLRLAGPVDHRRYERF